MVSIMYLSGVRPATCRNLTPDASATSVKLGDSGLAAGRARANRGGAQSSTAAPSTARLKTGLILTNRLQCLEGTALLLALFGIAPLLVQNRKMEVGVGKLRIQLRRLLKGRQGRVLLPQFEKAQSAPQLEAPRQGIE